MCLLLFYVLITSALTQAIYYESFSGKQIPLEEVKGYVKRNNSFWCLNDILPCDPYEGRRLDGSCNNLKYPSRGASHTPFVRLLPAEYDKDFEPKTAKNGEPLPLPREVRTSSLLEGRLPDSQFTQLLTHFWVYVMADVLSIQDTVKYIIWKPYCCQERGKTDRDCVPNKIPDDDPVHRFSSIRCLNLTRPESYQSLGCIKNNTIPERINSATSVFDLSQIYGNNLNNLNKKSRLMERGLLKTEEENGKIWPPSSKTQANVCLLNQRPQETRCHDTPEDGINSVLGVNLFAIWTWRYHNYIATELGKLNPCWNDERLFFTTRDIVTGFSMQIFYYELMPALLGYENLVRAGVLYPYKDFRDIYNDKVTPQISLEFPYVTRWAHTLQEGVLKMYDADGYHLKDTRITNLTLRTGYLVDTLEYITQGSFRQPAAKVDYAVDPDIAEVGLGPHQQAADILTSDLAKNRYFGFAPYVKYRKLCSGKSYTSFKDLEDVIDYERIEKLKEKYKHVEDIDLMAGIWTEKHVQGGRVPVTLYCIWVDQMMRTVLSDRHWYERPNRPNAFSLEQLLEIRKASVAQLMCAVGDTVKQIQPHAFYRAGPGNEMCSCNEITKMNLAAWKDGSCGPFNNIFIPE